MPPLPPAPVAPSALPGAVPEQQAFSAPDVDRSISPLDAPPLPPVQAEPLGASGPQLTSSGIPAAPPQPLAPVAPAATPSQPTASPAAPIAPAAPVVAAPAPAAAHFSTQEDSEEDRTIVVSTKTRWALELPNGDLYELVGDDIIVGRKPAFAEGIETLAITDPTRTVSKTHARLRRRGEGWTVEDLQSTNGIATGEHQEGPQQIEPGVEVSASAQMTFGTLAVQLRQLD